MTGPQVLSMSSLVLRSPTATRPSAVATENRGRDDSAAAVGQCGEGPRFGVCGSSDMAGREAAVSATIRLFLASGPVAGLDDGELLERFATRKDEAAFAALVALHGPMMLGVCRRFLRD